MAIYTVKKENESDGRAMKRFKKCFQNARILQEKRKRKYFARDLRNNKRVRRKKAVMRSFFRQKRAREQFYA